MLKKQINNQYKNTKVVKRVADINKIMLSSALGGVGVYTYIPNNIVTNNIKIRVNQYLLGSLVVFFSGSTGFIHNLPTNVIYKMRFCYEIQVHITLGHKITNNNCMVSY